MRPIADGLDCDLDSELFEWRLNPPQFAYPGTRRAELRFTYDL
jgi:hypothetical protein